MNKRKPKYTTFENINGDWVAALTKNGAIYETGKTEQEAIAKLKEKRKNA